MTPGQQSLLARLHREVADLTVRWDGDRRVVRLARAARLHPGDRERHEATVAAFLKAYGHLFGPQDLANRLRRLRIASDPLGWTHVEYQQEHETAGDKGRRRVVDVYGSKLVAHLDAEGNLVEVQSNCWRDVEVPTRVRVTAAAVQRRLAGSMPADADTRRRAPTLTRVPTPRLVIYPAPGRFRLAWTTYAYAPVAQRDDRGRETGALEPEPGDVFIDASTDELFAFFPSHMHVAGSGRAVTPINGPYSVRPLEVEQVGASLTHRLRDSTRTRAIVTYDDACTARSGAWTTKLDSIAAALDATLPPSQNTTGPNWNTVAASLSDADRTTSQQPEVDAHFFCAQAYDWYAAIGGRVGWDDDAFENVVEPNMAVRVVVHAHNPKNSASTPSPCRSGWTQFWRAKVADRWRAFLLFCDGDPSLGGTTPRPLDYPAGSKSLVGHEYQHAITYFSFRDGNGNPGIGYQGWGAALHEGLSDASGCMFASTWTLGSEVSHDSPPSVIRNLAFPRDPLSWENVPAPGGLGHDNKDHFADQNLPPATTDPGAIYDHGTILGHCAFLLDAGGVHERSLRVPAVIPVLSIGVESVGGGALVSRAARIFYRALASYSATAGQLTLTAADATMFPRFADACRSAAIQLYGAGSREHRTTALALYAVGLGEAGVSYGADVAFLRWAHDWRLSRTYLGGFYGTSPDWASLDLFVNNGSGSGWNAIVNVLDQSGNPTTFENRVYCRVRNVGDVSAANVTVALFYAKAGSGLAWLPVTDKNGAVQTLALPLLAAGAVSFPEADQDTPPATAGVPWHIPPLAPGEVVDHFCLKAVATCAADVNPHNNEVQSNIAYVPYAPGTTTGMGFLVGNPWDSDIELDVAIDTEVPTDWRVRVDGRDAKRLRPHEERPMRIRVDIPQHDAGLRPPLDGEIRGRLVAPMTGECRGTLTSTQLDGRRLRGRLSVDVEDIGTLRGWFEGELREAPSEVKGRVVGVFVAAGVPRTERLAAVFAGSLRPWRRVNVAHRIAGATVGGVTLQVQQPAPGGWPPIAPTGTRVDAYDAGEPRRDSNERQSELSSSAGEPSGRAREGAARPRRR